MPKQVDHAGRRRLIAEAVCRLADERGLEGVTLRDVASAAEVSMGAVQRCFRTKEEMLVFALGHVGERIGERVRASVVRSPAQSAGTALGHAVTEVSLLRAEHRAEARVWLAFVAQAAVSEPLAKSLRANYADLEEMFTRLVEQATGIPEAGTREGSGAGSGAGTEPGTGSDLGTGPGSGAGTDPDPGTGTDPRTGTGARTGADSGPGEADPRLRARTLLALADGLTTHVLVGHLTAPQAQDVLHAHLHGLWERQAR
ncbi:TetR family transcriptional regulator C-terminal domain-containing protein [Streptomyces sp. NPDC058657]|uniref:TetR family transcriptional regulator C-terminal domain-containing protein n=1 Tax=unclassified Streptomyces TaxID=2593676 RepID=UPI00364F4B52